MAPITNCANCGASEFSRDHQTGELVCSACGAVAEESRIVSEVSFSETSAGKAVVTGQYVSNEQSSVHHTGLYGAQAGESRQQTIDKARERMLKIGNRLGIPEHVVEGGVRFFRTALANNFVKGRKSQHVLSACLYLSCRMAKTDHMLMDFSELIHVNVFNIGATYLQLVRNQKISKLPIVDPTVYIQRFTAKLQFGPEGSKRVVGDAKKLVERMGKDWLQQGRRPAGVAAACILLAARMNNFRRSKAEIVQVAKVAEETLQRRLDEFRSTSAGTLSVSDFRAANVESHADPPSFTRHRELEQRLAKKLQDDEEARAQGKEPPDAYLDRELVEIARELDKEDGKTIELTQDVDAVLDAPGVQRVVEEITSEPRPAVRSRRAKSEEVEDEPDEESEIDEEAEREAEKAVVETLSRLSGKAAAGTLVDIPEEQEEDEEDEEDDEEDAEDEDEDEDEEDAAAPQVSSEPAKEKQTEEAEDAEDQAEEAEEVKHTRLQAIKAVKQESQHAQQGRAERYLLEFRQRREERIHREKQAEAQRIAGTWNVPDEENLSDVDDEEIESVILTEEEIELKSKVWMSINREYLLEQERKRLRQEADQNNGVVKSQRKRRKTRAKAAPGEQAASAEASAANMLKEKAHSKKINYAAVKELFAK